MKTKELMKNNFIGVCLLILGIGIISESWVPGSIQRFVETVRYEIAVHK